MCTQLSLPVQTPEGQSPGLGFMTQSRLLEGALWVPPERGHHGIEGSISEATLSPPGLWGSWVYLVVSPWPGACVDM